MGWMCVCAWIIMAKQFATFSSEKQHYFDLLLEHYYRLCAKCVSHSAPHVITQA